MPVPKERAACDEQAAKVKVRRQGNHRQRKSRGKTQHEFRCDPHRKTQRGKSVSQDRAKKYRALCRRVQAAMENIANAIRHCKQSIAAQKYRPLRHVNEPTQTRWVPSSSVPASLTTKDTCTKRDCVGSLNKLDGSPSCFAGDGIPILYGLEFGLPVLTLHKSCLTIEFTVRMHWRAPL